MPFQKFYNLAKNRLFTINRSITGKGIRKTLYLIKKEFPDLKIYKVPSKTRAFDWEVPSEWNVSDAYVLDKNNKKIIDFKKNNLHLVGYSTKINSTINKRKLFKHLHTLPKQLDAIPYVTSYYKKNWGFCITHRTKIEFNKKYKSIDKFKIVIKSNHNPNGNLNFGELVLKGSSKHEILISTYVCHPSMANNELSGPIVSMSLIEYFKKIKKLNKTIRFIFIPETIGSIVYLSKNLSKIKDNVIGGYNLSCIGDERMHSCMFSKYANSPSDASLIEAYKKLKIKYKRFSFLKKGSDERQFNSPGIDIPITSIFRTKYGEYPEYHTSLDDFKLVTLKGISGGFKVASNAIEILLKKIIPKNIYLCEPQMGKRGLYELKKQNGVTENFMSFLQYADGKNDLSMISKKIKVNLKLTKKIYLKLKKNKLIY
jgi:aminopeptidase-like protein